MDSLRDHVYVDEIIRVEMMSERDASDSDFEWGGAIEECKRELS